MSIEKHFLIIPASGIGTRMQSQIPKQYLKLKNGLSVLDQSLKTLLNLKQIAGCVIALAQNDSQFKHSRFNNHEKILATAIGGEERCYSVIAALKALKSFANDNDWVLIHDAARPCIKSGDVLNLITQLNNHPTGGLLATPVVDTIKQTNHNNNTTKTTLDRTRLWQAQTPQMYRFGVLSKALENAVENNLNITDESSAIEYLGLESMLVTGTKSNIKITTPKDLALANFYLKVLT